MKDMSSKRRSSSETFYFLKKPLSWSIMLLLLPLEGGAPYWLLLPSYEPLGGGELDFFPCFLMASSAR